MSADDKSKLDGIAAGASVNSVGLALPASLFSVSGSPITGGGTLTGSLQAQSPNLVFAGPASGGAAAPTFRALSATDVPAHNHSAAQITSGTLPAGRVDDTAHGNRGGGSLHALATTAVAGFLSAADKTKLDGVSLSLTWTAPTLLNSWANYGTGFHNAGYSKNSFGIVHLRGMVKSGTINTAIFTLPAGFRPAAKHLFTTTANSAIARVDIDTSGNVVCVSGSNVWLALDGISFAV
jgi:hypothetical protein